MLASGHRLAQAVKAAQEHSGFQNTCLLVVGECRCQPLKDSVSCLRVQGHGCDTAGHSNNGGVLQDVLSANGHPTHR